MPPIRSARLRDSASLFHAPGRKSISLVPADSRSTVNRISRYIEHFEVRLAELEDLVDMTTLPSVYSYGSMSQINLSTENNPNNQPAYGDRTGATESPCEGSKDGDADASDTSNGPIQL
ncbi:hypothetical protein DFH09DRAFT_1111292 [Mycena vulgaris]|nr:hypothetical protein DFH09DRAFT_1111292 [Mycena vulgaris]